MKLDENASAWSNHVDLHKKAQALLQIQKSSTKIAKPSVTDDDQNIISFKFWMAENGFDLIPVRLAATEEGNGLVATRDLKLDELVLSVPRHLMLTTGDAMESNLGRQLFSDPILHAHSSLQLVLYLLFKKENQPAKENTFWSPYFSILPRSFPLPIFFNLEELSLLRKSLIFGMSTIGAVIFVGNVLRFFRMLMRQYTHVFGLLQKCASPPILITAFTLDSFMWATSVVITRQNPIPNRHGIGTDLALIPIWDMCNHRDGPVCIFAFHSTAFPV